MNHEYYSHECESLSIFGLEFDMARHGTRTVQISALTLVALGLDVMRFGVGGS